VIHKKRGDLFIFWCQEASYKIMKIQMFTTLDKAKPDTENISYLRRVSSSGI
jgi:hypothetical protein